MYRLGPDLIASASTRFIFSPACTFVDVFFGALPLLWKTKRGIPYNLLHLAGFGCALFVFNILRLELGHLLFEKGLPWFLVHNVLAGFCYFLIWLWISRTAFPGVASISGSLTRRTETV